MSVSAPVIVWNRLYAGEIAGAVDISIDEGRVVELLNERWVAKQDKNYALADELAATLRSMDVVYQDDSKSWYTRVAIESKPVRSVVHRTKEQERNRRQAEKNKRNKLKKEKANEEKTADEVAEENPKKKKRI